MKSIRNRIDRIEKETDIGDLEVIAEILSRGAFYDELTDDEKNAYCDYRGTERGALETVEMMVTGTLHFRVQRKPVPSTEAEFRQWIEETEILIEEIIRKGEDNHGCND